MVGGINMKIVKLSILALICFPLGGCADEIHHFTAEEMLEFDNAKTPHERNMAMNKFIPDGLPRYGEGIVIKPSNSRRMVIQSLFNPVYSTEEAQNALNFIGRIYEVEKTSGLADRENTNLQESHESIPLSFIFKPLNLVANSVVIGFSPFGGYYENHGWSGISEIFDSGDLGRCHFVKQYYKLFDGSIYLKQEDIVYFINSKPTTFEVSGAKGKAYMYTLDWFDSDYSQTLECANTRYSHEIISKMVALAKDIDNGK